MKMDFKKLTFGTWVTIGNASICELISSFDFDWVCFDLEHSSLNYTDLYSLIPIVEKNLKLPVVRVARNDEVEIKRALDAGAKAIIIPNIKDKHEAKQAVNYCKYKPMGIRGVGLSRAQGYGFKFKEYLKISNKIPLFLLIENKEAIENLEEIISTKGVSGSIIGPYDLSASIGKAGDFSDKKFVNAIKKYERVCKKQKKIFGMHAVNDDVKQIKNKIKIGYRFIGIKLDTLLLGEACEKILNDLK
tara:strand:+ start:1868 stop:2605 length:738 start_codon:yes stop_codon:yes gene_type:complete